MHIVSKVWNFIKPRRKLSLATFVIILVVVGIVGIFIFGHLGVSVAHAVTSAPATSVPDRGPLSKVVDIIGSIFLTIAQLFIQVTIFILRFVIEVGAYNGYIDSTAVNYGWIMVRDVTNMFFVIILLVIAFGTILGLEQYEYKKLLFKMIAAAVIVNFSRTICGLIIDVAQVIMVTFINGVAATAGGNLINMFNMNEVLFLARSVDGKSITSSNIFLASVAALVFSAMAMATMFVFLIMLLARLITLWILIVLSPLAFVLNVIPQTQKYASQWWTEFGNNVISGPIIAFFLWLAFVTVGAGNANEDIVAGLANKNLSVAGGTSETVGSSAAGVSKAMDWTKMANFAIAIGMLLVGAKMAQQLGVAGGAMMGKAVDFGKKVAMAAGGISAARWAGRKGLAAGKAAGKFVAMKAPIIGGEAWQRRGRAIKAVAGIAATKVGMGRDYLAAQMGKALEKEKEGAGRARGWRGMLRRGALAAISPMAGVAARGIESGARAEKRVKYLESYGKTLKEKQEETAQLGTTWAARKAGASSRELDDTKRLNERAKREALDGVEAERLKKASRYDDAEALLASSAAKTLKEDAERYQDLDQNGLKAAALNLIDQTNVAKEDFKKAGPAEEREIADKLTQLELKKRALVAVAGSRGYSDYGAVTDTLKEASGYNGSDEDKTSPQQMKSLLSGFNVNDEGGRQQLGRLAALLEKRQQRALEASDRQLRTNGHKLFKESGDVRPVAAFGQGIEQDPATKHRRVTTGLGANVGQFKTDGTARAPSERHDPMRADPEVLNFYQNVEPPSFQSTVNANIFVRHAPDAQTGAMKTFFDEKQTELLANYMNKFSPATLARFIQPGLIKQLNNMVKEGKLSKDQLRSFIEGIKKQVKLELRPAVDNLFSESSTKIGAAAEEEDEEEET